MKIKKSLITALKIIFTLILLFLIFKSVDVSKISGDLAALHVPSLLLLLGALWVGQLLCSERWRLFAVSLGMHGSLRSFIKLYFAGMFFNIGLPTLIGGDVVKAYMLSRKCDKPISFGLATVIQDRVAGLFFLLLYGSVAILLFPLTWRGIPLWTAHLSLWIAVAAAFILLYWSARLLEVPLKTENESFARKTVRAMAEFHQALAKSSMTKGMFLRICIYSLLNAALALWIFQHVTVAAGHPVGIIPFAALFPLITLVTMLPITLGGIGLREWVYVEALSLVGIPREAGLVI
ncbi:MAG TPA: lysylphosphatidylglycerol synthase transmembrane domain-containing protein, partial [Acidobacteriota bacterium]|nr:lysylphosphatidylglycerol synthase transmembrane domain-containing protein [Acidobacteriota bacterium]